ncbi:hypothetical protein [Desulfovibrio sp. JC010]|uniref:hypothetical protein n=1 Tax=Desulfovibrio sp. JC010 TaxID=2593641 RepID=UPI0013D760BE|nr:hypothetical protein [Desulfovibrio sp. JC010]NDV26276.1 hypothetical protein [Desulfovibrio sp. JC010]
MQKIVNTDFDENSIEGSDYDAWFRSEVQKGLDELNRGEVIPHEEVIRSIKELGYEIDESSQTNC